MQAGGQNKEEIILVYDLGGGTFDVSVIQVGKDGIKILVTGGKNDLGGKNWDDRLITYLAAKFEEENGVNPLTNPFAHQELRTKGEIAKKTLTSREKVPFTFAFAGFKWRLELDRAKFEEITADLLDLTVQVTHETLDALQAKTGNRKVERFFLVGGSSRMPMVKARIDREFGVDSEKYDPDECVAKGAALWGVKRKIDGLAEQAGYDIQTGEGNKNQFDKELRKELEGVKNLNVYKGLTMPGKTWGNVSSHTYGIKAFAGDDEIVVPLLTQNTEIPYTYESEDGQFGTAVANQATIEVILMEADGESLDPAFCKEIGRGTVELPRGVPKNSEVKILFDYEGDGTIELPRPRSLVEPGVRGQAHPGRGHGCRRGRPGGEQVVGPDGAGVEPRENLGVDHDQIRRRFRLFVAVGDRAGQSSRHSRGSGRPDQGQEKGVDRPSTEPALSTGRQDEPRTGARVRVAAGGAGGLGSLRQPRQTVSRRASRTRGHVGRDDCSGLRSRRELTVAQRELLLKQIKSEGLPPSLLDKVLKSRAIAVVAARKVDPVEQIKLPLQAPALDGVVFGEIQNWLKVLAKGSLYELLDLPSTTPPPRLTSQAQLLFATGRRCSPKRTRARPGRRPCKPV